MQDCQVCGRRFDPLTFQVVVPELGRGFDCVECARSARSLALPGSRMAAAAPLVAIVDPITAALGPASTAGRTRPFGAPVATLGILAAGTAVAVVLWLRVLGADTTNVSFSRAAAPPAFGHETVQAHVQPASGAHAAAQPTSRPAAAPVTTLIAARRQPASTSPSQGSRRPLIRARPAPTVNSPSPTGHQTGKGHIKHGESDGAHSPGHGQHGKHANGAGHGNGKGKAKH